MSRTIEVDFLRSPVEQAKEKPRIYLRRKISTEAMTEL